MSQDMEDSLVNRRKFLKKSIIGLSTAAFAGTYATKVEPYWVEHTKQMMQIKNLPLNLVNKILVQISDLHIGDRFDYHYQIKELEKVNNLNPDFVVYTGDFITYKSDKQIEQLQEVFKHVALGKHGTFAILGNHDYGRKWQQKEVADKVVQTLSKHGIQFLRNQKAESQGLNFIGLDDFWGPNFFPQEVMKNIDHKAANIVLCHNPDALDEKIWNDYKGWVLCGHTHGGQCRLPFFPPPILPIKNKKYASGKIELEDGRIAYVNRALGHLWPIRFGVRPEISIFKLIN